MMVDRFFPDRTATLRPSTVQEIKATAVIVMEIERASAKIRSKGLVDDEEDYDLPVYAERLPVHTVLGAPSAVRASIPASCDRRRFLLIVRDARWMRRSAKPTLSPMPISRRPDGAGPIS